MITVAIYARVSTDRGEQDPQVQVDALKRWVEANGNTVGKVYVDHISGRAKTRPALDNLLADLEAGIHGLEAIAVVKLDRLGRSVRNLIQLVTSFEEMGVDLMVKDQQIDTSTGSGKLLFHILGAMAEFERDLISERTKAGMAYARDHKGVKLGRKRRKIDLPRAQRLRHTHGSIAAAARIMEIPVRTLGRRLVSG